MTDHTSRRDSESGGVVQRGDSSASADLRATPADTQGVAATDAYVVEEGVVLFDIDNPLAWVEADDAVPLSRMA